MEIGPYTAHPGVLWKNEFDSPGISQQINFTIQGTPKITTLPNPKREIILEARDGGTRARGYFSREILEYLRSSEISGSVVVIEYRGVSYNTVVKAGGIKVVPKRETEAVDSSDIYVGTITLQEV